MSDRRTSSAWLQPGRAVWYSPTLGGKQYAGFVDSAPRVLGGHTCVVSLRDMEEAYSKDCHPGGTRRTRVAAASVDCVSPRVAPHTCASCPACLDGLAGDERWIRLAKSFDGKEREWSPHEKYQLYARGFRDGAANHSMKHEGLGSYDRGYADGIQARRMATSSYAREVGYEPTILRTEERKDG